MHAPAEPVHAKRIVRGLEMIFITIRFQATVIFMNLQTHSLMTRPKRPVLRKAHILPFRRAARKMICSIMNSHMTVHLVV